VLADIGKEIKNGQTLEKALSRHPRVFDTFYRSIVGIGEESGNLEENLDHLAKIMAKSHEFSRKLQGAMLYPSIVLSVALVVGGGISVFVLPQLVDLFESIDVELPTATKVLLFLAQTMKNYGVALILGAMLVFAFFLILIKSRPVKPLWHRLVLSLPLAGFFFQSSEIASFTRSLGMMLGRGLPISRALKIAEESEDNLVYKGYLGRIWGAVEKGKTIESELSSGKYPFIPLIVPKMIGVGERTGKLDESLLYLADFFEEEVDDMAKNLPTVLEPVMLVIIALVVAFLAFSIISPIYEFTASIKR